ncbi:Golgi resident protein GCP60 [Fopius arisanus]|uniref:Golgi resident protein GCP60 n=1 Tax=Fopius arisanus TaxID=64838 RepID=A0A9R1TLB6_9HYME|nr:PREDICTED: Golgi resident protein GCP60 [Fopius arisanus]
MASTEGDVVAVTEDIDKLSVSTQELSIKPTSIVETVGFQPHLSGFETRELYKIALNFYKEKEGKAVHLSYEDKLKLVAFTQQATHGKCTAENSPELGVLDVIGKDRRLAWQNLGDITREEAMEGFIILLDKLCPLFRTVVEAQKRNIEEQERRKNEEKLKRIEEEKREREIQEERKREEEEQQKREHQRRQIQEALNQQTYHQFKAYAEQQYPGNPEQQGVLIRQLQEQHYHRYMQQLHQNRLMIEESAESEKKEIDETDEEEKKSEGRDEVGNEVVKEGKEGKGEKESNANNGNNEEEEEDSDGEPDWPPIETPKMWTRPGVDEFKDTIKREAGDAVIRVGHGETVTVRVPTHEDGAFLFWEFATDGYDIGFGVYFEWSKPETNQVSVHISESEDDDDEDDYAGEDLETGVNGESNPEEKPSSPQISVIVPVFRRDSQEEVYAGSHQYPGEGVYLLKFDNSYSLWRSKTLYYRVYYTRPGFTDNPS